MPKLSVLRVIVFTITALVSCTRDEARTTPHAAEPTLGTNDEQAVLRARAVDEDGRPMATRALLLEPFKSCRNGDMYTSGSTSHETRTDNQGRFTLPIPKRVGESCTRSVLVRLASRDVRDWPGGREPSFRIELPLRIETAEFDAGVVRLIAPSRRFRQLSDDELERTAVGAETRTLSTPQRELESVLSEMVRRGGQRFESFLEAQVKALREKSFHEKPWMSPALEGEFFFLTALRRLQHRPDPLAIRIVDGATTPARFPLGPVFHAQLVNVDDEGTRLLVVEDDNDWNENWRAEVRTLSGERVPLRPWPWLGGSDPRARRALKPGESEDDHVALLQYAAVAAAGTYEARLLYLAHDKIGQEVDLEDRIFASSAWTRFEILPGTIRSTHAEQERAHAAIARVDDTTPVRVWYVPYDPLKPFTTEPRASDEVLWVLGWKSMKPLLDALDQKPLTAHKRAWILAQLYNLTGLHAPFADRGVLVRFEFVSVRFSEERRDFAVTPADLVQWKIDEAKQLAFAERWRKTAQSFVFEIAPDAQPK